MTTDNYEWTFEFHFDISEKTLKIKIDAIEFGL